MSHILLNRQQTRWLYGKIFNANRRSPTDSWAFPLLDPLYVDLLHHHFLLAFTGICAKFAAIEFHKLHRTETPPVSFGETVEIYAFMEAADESKRQGGASVSIEEVIAKASR